MECIVRQILQKKKNSPLYSEMIISVHGNFMLLHYPWI
jgi:hypothetical protein